MGAMKQAQLEETEHEALIYKEVCRACHKKLDREDVLTGHEVCFDCYCEEQYEL